MRIQALILVFPFAVFLTETASFMPAMQDACTIVAEEKNSCCIKTENTEEEECGGKTADDTNNSGDDCTNNPDCSTCPVCYTFIFQPQFEWSAKQFLFTKNYGSLNTSYTSFYIPDVWKPPNGFLYYA